MTIAKRISAAQYIRETAAREARIAAARKALAQLQPGEWDDVMRYVCPSCGGRKPCTCLKFIYED